MSVSRRGWMGKRSIKSILLYMAVACGINLIIFLMMDSLNFVHFGMNDDFYIQNLLNGSMGDYYTHFAHCSVIFSSVMAGLYRVFGAVNWYGVYLFAALTLSCGMVGGVVMDKFGARLGGALYFLVLPVCYGMVVANMTYTLVCYAMIACALVCLVYAFYMENKNTRWFLYIVSGVALVSALLLRTEAIASAAVYCAALTLLLVIKYRKKALGFLLAMAVCFGMMGIFALVGNAYYSSSEELKNYREFNSARVDLVDHQPLEYARYPGVFDEVGWSAADTDYFKNYLGYPDGEQFTVQNMEYIYDNISETRYNTDFSLVLQQTINQLLQPEYTYMLICFAGVFAVAFYSQKKKLFKIFVMAILLLPFVFQLLFGVLWRSVERTWYPHYMMSILLLLAMVDFAALSKKIAPEGRVIMKRGITAAMGIVLAVAVVGAMGMLHGTYTDRQQTDAELSASYGTSTQKIREAYNKIRVAGSEAAFMYPITNPLIRGNEAYSIFQVFPKDYFINSRLIGGWDTRSPAYNDFKERYGLNNLPKDIAGSEVRLVSPDLARIQAYFMEAYGLDVQYGEELELAPNIISVKTVIAN